VTITVAFIDSFTQISLEKLTGHLSDESLGKCTVEESAVANVVIEGNKPDIDDLKKEIKLTFLSEFKTMDSFRIIIFILLSLITNVEMKMNCLTTECAVLHGIMILLFTVHGIMHQRGLPRSSFRLSNHVEMEEDGAFKL
jgi:hypothetical protein